MTHNNPYSQGGWESELAASYSYSPSVGSGTSSPAISQNSSGSSDSSVPTFSPPQSSYGALPTVTPGARPIESLASYHVFRFESIAGGTELAVMAGSTVYLRIRPGQPADIVDGNLQRVARVGWQQSGAIVERSGAQRKSSEIIRPMPGHA